jgi:hypothetical protein
VRSAGGFLGQKRVEWFFGKNFSARHIDQGGRESQSPGFRFGPGIGGHDHGRQGGGARAEGRGPSSQGWPQPERGGGSGGRPCPGLAYQGCQRLTGIPDTGRQDVKDSSGGTSPSRPALTGALPCFLALAPITSIGAFPVTFRQTTPR